MSEGAYTPQRLVDRVVRDARLRGLRPVAGDLARWGLRALLGVPWAVRGSRGRFTFDGRSHRYLYHPHKLTWLTERAVEVPIIQSIVDRHAGARILEVGNVLSHYRAQSHLIVDKYERAPGVVNRDALELDDLGPFDLIVAVSTFEHVGWDEQPRAQGMAAEAIRRVAALLAPGGRMVMTLPVGYNADLDGALRAGAIAFTRLLALRRRTGSTAWRQVAPEQALSASYDFLLYSARGVLVAEIERAAS